MEDIHRRQLVRVGKALLRQAVIEAAAGTRPAREEIQEWIDGAAAPWTFSDTCHILSLDEELQRKRIQRRLDLARQVRKEA